MKIYISQAISDEDSMTKARNEALRALQAYYPDDTIEAFYHIDIPSGIVIEKKTLYYLTMSAMAMSAAELVVFLPGWESHFCSNFEHRIALEHGFKIIESDEMKTIIDTYRNTDRMTAGMMIETLKEYPPDAPVYVTLKNLDYKPTFISKGSIEGNDHSSPIINVEPVEEENKQ